MEITTMGLPNKIKAIFIDHFIKNLAKSEPITTVGGAVLAAIVAANVDYSAVLNKDPQQIANLASAVVVCIVGYYTNHADLVRPKIGSTQEAGEKMPPTDSLK
jgi:hypothetical protein